MTDFELTQPQYLRPTPAGVYHAVSQPVLDKPGEVLLGLIADDRPPWLSEDSVTRITGIDDPDAAWRMLYRLQEMRLIQGLDQERTPPEGTLDMVLTGIIRQLAGEEKALLADTQGFHLANRGFPHETAEELSALSADLATLHNRHYRLLRNNMNLGSNAWALVNAGGNSDIGFWPMFIGEHRFVLILTGLPNLNQPAFVDLVWVLTRRYYRSPV